MKADAKNSWTQSIEELCRKFSIPREEFCSEGVGWEDGDLEASSNGAASVVKHRSLNANLTKIEARGDGSLIYCGKSSLDKCQIVTESNNCAILIGDDVRLKSVYLSCAGSGAVIVIASHSTWGGGSGICRTPGEGIYIGEFSMLSSNVNLSTDDEFVVFDRKTSVIENPTGSVLLRRRVWLGRHSTVRGPANIGQGTIVGMGAYIEGDIDSNCAVVGNPGRIVKRGVDWRRSLKVEQI